MQMISNVKLTETMCGRHKSAILAQCLIRRSKFKLVYVLYPCRVIFSSSLKDFHEFWFKCSVYNVQKS